MQLKLFWIGSIIEKCHEFFRKTENYPLLIKLWLNNLNYPLFIINNNYIK